MTAADKAAADKAAADKAAADKAAADKAVKVVATVAPAPDLAEGGLSVHWGVPFYRDGKELVASVDKVLKDRLKKAKRVK